MSEKEVVGNSLREALAELSPEVDGPDLERVRRFIRQAMDQQADLLQSAAQVEQEREVLKDKLMRRTVELAETQAERDRLKDEVARLGKVIGDTPVLPQDYQNVCDAVVFECRRAEKAEADVAYWKAAHLELAERLTAAEADATRLRGMWEALKADADHFLGPSAAQSLFKRMAELEATPSGPAEEGR